MFVGIGVNGHGKGCCGVIGPGDCVISRGKLMADVVLDATTTPRLSAGEGCGVIAPGDCVIGRGGLMADAVLGALFTWVSCGSIIGQGDTCPRLQTAGGDAQTSSSN